MSKLKELKVKGLNKELHTGTEVYFDYVKSKLNELGINQNNAYFSTFKAQKGTYQLKQLQNQLKASNINCVATAENEEKVGYHLHVISDRYLPEAAYSKPAGDLNKVIKYVVKQSHIFQSKHLYYTIATETPEFASIPDFISTTTSNTELCTETPLNALNTTSTTSTPITLFCTPSKKQKLNSLPTLPLRKYLMRFQPKKLLKQLITTIYFKLNQPIIQAFTYQYT